MNHARILLSVLIVVTTACEGPMLPAPPPLPPLPGMSQSAPAYEQSDNRYLPDEYRSGYDIGGRDASYGYPLDGRRAYDRFGHGSEDTFNEGYADGYEHRGPRR